MKPEDLIQKLKDALGDDILSVVLYGSAAAGDFVGKRSDYNVLVVTRRLGIRELTQLAKPSEDWRKSGNPSPLYFTLERLQSSADVFPIELLDIKQTHRVLYGEDVLARVEVDPGNLRLILEHELKSLLIRLREEYLTTEGKPKRVAGLMVDSLSSVLVLFRAALRLFQAEVPALKLEALEALRSHIDFDATVFVTIEKLKEGEVKAKQIDAASLFETYLKTIESIVDKVDAHVHAS